MRIEGANDKIVMRKIICIVMTKSEGPDASSSPIVILGRIFCPIDTAGITIIINRRLVFFIFINFIIWAILFLIYDRSVELEEISLSAVSSFFSSSINSFIKFIDCSETPISNFRPSIRTIIKYCFGLMCCFPNTSIEK